jgi:hypothetical protein
MTYRYVVTATPKFQNGWGNGGMEIEVSAKNAKQAISYARGRSGDYFDRHDGPMTWRATKVEA